MRLKVPVAATRPTNAEQLRKRRVREHVPVLRANCVWIVWCSIYFHCDETVAEPVKHTSKGVFKVPPLALEVHAPPVARATDIIWKRDVRQRRRRPNNSLFLRYVYSCCCCWSGGAAGHHGLTDIRLTKNTSKTTKRPTTAVTNTPT